MNNLYSLLIKLSTSPTHCRRLSASVKGDISLHRQFLRIAKDGISMNLLTYRQSTHAIIGDASEYGLGAFHLESGRGWAWYIPQHLQGRAHINLLEFLTQLIQIWVDIIEGRIHEEDCILAMGDNTTAMGWLRRSNFRETDEDGNDWKVKQQVARKVATLVLDVFKAMLYTQWFAGEHNICADSLSRDCLYLDPSSHEHFLKHYFPKQTPANLQIRPVPNEIISFVSSILQQLPVKQQRLTVPKPSELLRGVTGTLFCSPSDLARKSTLTAWTNLQKASSLPHSLSQSAKAPTPLELKTNWSRAQSMPPSHMWHRPSGQTTGKTQDWTLMAKHVISSKSNFADTRTQINTKASKKRFQHQS
jgi:hypothetical protein